MVEARQALIPASPSICGWAAWHPIDISDNNAVVRVPLRRVRDMVAPIGAGFMGLCGALPKWHGTYGQG